MYSNRYYWRTKERATFQSIFIMLGIIMSRIRSSLIQNSLLAPAQPETKAHAMVLWAHIEKAEYEKIQKIWKINPQLMFTSLEDKNGKITTPLRQAFFNLDTHAWKPFYEWIKVNHPTLVDQFLEQNKAQKEHINMTPLFDFGYSHLIERLSSYTGPHAEAAKSLKQKQNNLLPWHMLRELCCEQEECSSESSADNEDAPAGGRVYIADKSSWVDIDSQEFFDGENPTYRTHDTNAQRYYARTWCYDNGVWFGSNHPVVIGLKHDMELLRRLEEAGREELAEIPPPLPPMTLSV
jgi:hypothetical protein